MERDLNLKLIYIILILLLALGGLAVFYQIRYEKLKADYDAAFDTFNSTLKNLTVKQKELYSDLGNLNMSANRELALVSRLEKKSLELENTSRELALVQQELFEYQRKYDDLNVNYTIANDILNRNRESIGILQEKIDRLKNDAENGASRDIILQDAAQLQNELNKLKTY